VQQGSNKSSSNSTSARGDDSEGWELESIGGTNIDEVLANLVVRMDFFETENKLLKEKKGLIFVVIYFQ
jgi:hypothetical protein